MIDSPAWGTADVPDEFTLAHLLDLLVQEMGLPARYRASPADEHLSDLGLDSFDFAHLQVELSERLGVELPDERDTEFTLAEIVRLVQQQLAGRRSVPEPRSAPPAIPAAGAAA
jgi:acyl carrier protein